MSVRSEQTVVTNPAADMAAAIADAQPADAALGEGNAFAVSSPENPLSRQVSVSIRSSLNELCLQKGRGTWSPSPEALKSIFQCAPFRLLCRCCFKCLTTPVRRSQAEALHLARRVGRADGRPQGTNYAGHTPPFARNALISSSVNTFGYHFCTSSNVLLALVFLACFTALLALLERYS